MYSIYVILYDLYILKMFDLIFVHYTLLMYYFIITYNQLANGAPRLPTAGRPAFSPFGRHPETPFIHTCVVKTHFGVQASRNARDGLLA